MSNEKNPGCLGYIGDEILPSHEICIPIIQPGFQWKVRPGFFFVAQNGYLGFRAWCFGFRKDPFMKGILIDLVPPIRIPNHRTPNHQKKQDFV